MANPGALITAYVIMIPQTVPFTSNLSLELQIYVSKFIISNPLWILV